MCITVNLGLSNDEDVFIKASVIRTLGIYVLYKSLREVGRVISLVYDHY